MSKKKSCVWSRRTKALKTPKRGDLRKWVKNDNVKTCMFRASLGEFNTFFFLGAAACMQAVWGTGGWCWGGGCLLAGFFWVWRKDGLLLLFVFKGGRV